MDSERRDLADKIFKDTGACALAISGFWLVIFLLYQDDAYSFMDRIGWALQGGFFVVGVPGVFAVILTRFTQMNEKHLVACGAMIYYGFHAAMLIVSLLSGFMRWDMSKGWMHAVSFTISCLVTYIVWLKKYKPEEEKKKAIEEEREYRARAAKKESPAPEQPDHQS